MGRLDTLKTQYPYLNITILDLLSEIDGTKSHKYLQLLCKLFKKSWLRDLGSEGERIELELDNKRTMERLGILISQDPLVNITKRRFLDLFRHDDVEMFQQFKSYMESDQIEVSDLTKYDTMSDVRNAVSYATIKQSHKKLEKQVHKEYEDDTWLLLRPLSFESSSVYGSGTRWCTTFRKEKEYFFKYFFNGSLIYILNKKTGYKFAMYVDIYERSNIEISFWNAEDTRVDFLSLDVDDYLIPILRKIKESQKKNSEFLSTSDLYKVALDCNSLFRINEQSLEATVKSVTEYDPPTYTQIAEAIPTMRA